MWHDGQRVVVRRKTFEVLSYLVTHANQLVTTEVLLEVVWPKTVVGDGVLKVSIRELRKIFGESAKAPKFIVTEHRRGYRFVAPVTVTRDTAQRQATFTSSTSVSDKSTQAAG